VAGKIYRARTCSLYRGRPVSLLGVRGMRSAIVVADYNTPYEVALGVVRTRGTEDLEEAVKKLVGATEQADRCP
jgi:hypothetical protein